MEILDKILYNLTHLWNTLPKDIPVLTISQGSGTYPMISVSTEQIYFHTDSYDVDMPIADTIVLDDYTLKELVDVINSMGYIASLTSEDIYNDNDYSARKAFVLMEAYNVPLNPSATLNAFMSATWKTLYPLARMIDSWAKRLDTAIPQMYATTASGEWADYWASYFNVQRMNGDSDDVLRKRMFMNIANIKTNNVALAELVSFAIKGDVAVKDISPALFEVTIDPKFIATASIVHSSIDASKAGGVKYYLNYLAKLAEDYEAYFSDRNGIAFKDSAVISGTATKTLSEASPYGFAQVGSALTLNTDTIGTNGTTMQTDRLLTDTFTVQFSINGVSLLKPCQNLLIDGNFAKDSNSDGVADGWSCGGANKSVSNNTQIFTPTAQYGSVLQSYNRPLGHKLYFSARVKASNTSVILQSTNNSNWNNATYGAVTGDFKKLSFIETALSTSDNVSVQDNGTSGFTEIQVQQMYVLDLTDTFGAGNEPTQAWCDANIAFSA